MKIYASGATNIVHFISEFKNKNINNKELNRNLLSSLIFNYYYFKKDSKKTEKVKKIQKQLFQNFLSQEEKQIKTEKLYLSKERNKIRRDEMYQNFAIERKMMLDNYKGKKYFTEIIEPTYDCYIPKNQFSIPLEFYTNKIVSNIYEEENKEIKEDNKINSLKELENNDILKGTNEYDIKIPIHLCENNYCYFDDNYFTNEKEEKENQENEELLDILNTNDNELFYEDEKMDLKRQNRYDIKNKNKLSVNTKTIVNTNEDFELDKNLSKNEIVENHYKEFNCYLNLSIYTKYIKKMNYLYLHLMLMNYFDLEYKLNNGLDLYRETIVINHIKGFILKCGICSYQLYDKIIKNALSIKGDYSFENFLLYFSPIFKANEEYQSYKYKYLLHLIKNNYRDIMTQLEFDMFLNLVKGKSIYDRETYSDLIKRFKIIYKKQYPKENEKEYIFNHVYTILEFIIDLNYENLAD